MKKSTMNHIMAMVNDIEAAAKEQALLREAEVELAMWYSESPDSIYWHITSAKFETAAEDLAWLDISDEDKYDLHTLTELIARTQAQLNDLSIPERLELIRGVREFIWDSMAEPSEEQIRNRAISIANTWSSLRYY